MYPHLTHDPAWFSFLVHPRDMADLYRCRETAFLLDRSESEQDFIVRLRHQPPTVIGEITFSGSAVRGEIIAVGFLPRDMFGSEARRKLIEALELARNRGARTVGLGGLTSSATKGGQSLLAYADLMTLTNGSAYTVATVVSQVKDAVCLLGIESRARVGVLGCTGSVGVPASRLLAEAGFELVLVGKNASRVRNLLGDLPGCTFSGDPMTLRRADVVVLLTSAGGARIGREHISESTVVLDFAQPPNVSPDLEKAFLARGVIVSEGGLVTIPGYRNSCDWGVQPPESTFACLAETVLFSREGLRGHSVGTPSPDSVRRMDGIAQRYGVTPLPVSRLAKTNHTGP